MPYKDKEVRNTKAREYYHTITKSREFSLEEKEHKLKLKRAVDLQRRYKRKLLAIELHGDKCADCGKTYHPSCYDFHHLDPKEKDFNPCSGLSKHLDVFMKEIKKCIMLCANCHRVRHSLYDTAVR